MSIQVKTIAILVARDGKADELRALLESLVKPSRSEPGNLRYDLWRHQQDANRFVLDEVYADADAVEAHRASVHFQNYLAKIGHLAERTVFLLDPISV